MKVNAKLTRSSYKAPLKKLHYKSSPIKYQSPLTNSSQLLKQDLSFFHSLITKQYCIWNRLKPSGSEPNDINRPGKMVLTFSGVLVKTYIFHSAGLWTFSMTAVVQRLLAWYQFSLWITSVHTLYHHQIIRATDTIRNIKAMGSTYMQESLIFEQYCMEMLLHKTIYFR